MPLLRSQEAWVFERLIAHEFDPRDFDLVDGVTRYDRRVAPILRHRASGFYFAFAKHPNQSAYWVEFSPGHNVDIDSYGTGGWDPIVDQQFVLWLQRLRLELDAPDYWGALRGEGAFVGGPADIAQNTPFSPDEQAEVRRQLEEVKTLVRGTYALTEAQFEAIDGRLDYLAEAAGRLGRVDWREALVGALLGLVVQAVVPPEPIREAVLIITRGLGHLFGIHVPELPSP